MKKYELTNETKTLEGGTVLHRIRALRDIPRFGVNAGELGGFVEGEINLSQDGDAWVSGNARVFGDAKVSGNACVFDNAKVYGNACVSGNAKVYGNACVFGNAGVSGNAWVYDNAEVYGNAKVSGNAEVSGDADISGDAEVSANSDYMVVKNIWSSGRWFTYTRSNKKWAVGCFYGTGEELIKKAYKDSELSGKCYEAIVHAVETIEAANAEAKETK